MTEVLGEAVLDLTADIGPLVRKEAEARQITEREMGAMSRAVDNFALRVTGLGTTFRQFADVADRALDGVERRVVGAATALGRLEGAVHGVRNAFLQLGPASTAMSREVGAALDSVQRDALSTAATVVAASAAEERAIDAVTAAYLAQAAAMRAVSGESRLAITRAAAVGLPGAVGRQLGHGPAEVPRAREIRLAGARGYQDIGGIANPMTVVIEASQFAGLGTRAAAIAFSNMLPKAQEQVAQRIQQVVGPPPGQRQATRVMGQEQTVSLEARQYAGIITAITAAHADEAKLLTVLAAQRALPRSTSPDWMRGSGGMLPPPDRPVAFLPPGGGGGGRELGPGFVFPQRPALPAPGQTVGGSQYPPRYLPQTVSPDWTRAEQDATQATKAQTEQLRSTVSSFEDLAGALRDNTRATEANTAALLSSGVGAPSGAGGPGGAGGAGGGRRSDIFYHSGGGDGGGGPGALSRLLWGGGGRLGMGRFGIGGLAGFGSAASFAGLGPEHALMTGLGIAGSAGAAAGGAGLLGLGAAGQLAVGAGSNAAVMKSTISDTQALAKNYKALDTAVATYGAGSQQAATAQKQLNAQIQDLGGASAVGVKAEMQLAQASAALNTMWDKQTQKARVEAVAILNQVLGLGRTYVPKVAAAAEQNLAIINKDIQPLFQWLEGPKGIGIFNNLENNFKRTLPTAIDAFSQSLEVVLRVTSIASNYTGGFVKSLDNLARRLNALPDSTLNKFVGHLVGDFQTWERFVKALISDLYYLFHADAGTGTAIVATLTAMLDKLGQWEKSTRGQQQMHNIFEVHKQEVLELLQLLPPLISSFGHIYLTLAPPLTQALTGILTVLVHVLDTMVKLGPATSWLLGLTLIAGKLFGFKTVLTQIGTALGFITAKKTETDAYTEALNLNTAALGRNAEAQKVNASTMRVTSAGNIVSTYKSPLAAGTQAATKEEQAASTGLFSSIRTGASSALSTGLTAALRGGSIALIGSLVASTIGGMIPGAIGHAVSHIGSDAAIGAGLGSVFGPEGTIVGLFAGGLLGGLQTFIHDDAKRQGEDFAKRFASSLPGQISDATKQGVAHATTTAITATRPVPNAPHAAGPQAPGGLPSLPGLPPGITRSSDIIKQFDQLYNQVFNKVFIDGQKTGQAWIQGMQAVKFPTTPIIVQQAEHALENPPKQLTGQALQVWREAAAQQMIAYAHGLEQKGQLPKGATDSLIRQIEQKFPSLTNYLRTSGQSSSAALASTLKFTQARSNLESFINKFRTDWGENLNVVQATNLSIYQATGQAMDQLHVLMHSKNKGIRDAATREWQGLQSDINNTLGALAGQVSAQMANIKKPVTQQSALAAIEGSSSFQSFQSAVWGYMDSGALGSGQGAQKIVDELNQVLKQLNQKQLTPVQVEGIQMTAAIQKGAQAAATALGSFERGGLMQVGHPNERGHDTVGLNVGGVPIRVGPGEQVAVFTRHQQPVMDRALQREGYAGLEGLFSSVRTPNYMAEGGFVPGFQLGGSLSSIAGTASGAGGGYKGYSLPLPRSEMMPGSWSFDMGVDIPAPAGTPEFAIGPGTITQEGISGFGPNAPILKLSAGPWAGTSFYYGHAGPDNVPVGATVGAGQQISQVGAGIVGISTGPHIEFGVWPAIGGAAVASQYLNPLMSGAGVTGVGGGGGAGGGITIPHIKAPKVTGGGGLADIVQAGLNVVASAGNTYLQQFAGQASGTASGTLGSVGGTGSVTAANLQAIAKSLGYNWDEGQIHAWLNVIAAESGGNPTAQNPTSTAYGIGQFLDSTWGSYGTSQKTSDAHLQLVDMAKYIQGRYGTPEAAWASEQSIHSYALGGLLDAIGFESGTPNASVGGGGAGAGFEQTSGKPLTAAQKSFLAKYARRHHGHVPPPQTLRNKGIQRSKVQGVSSSKQDMIGTQGPLPFWVGDTKPISSVLQWLLALDDPSGGSGSFGDPTKNDAAKLSEYIQYYSNYWATSLFPTPNFSSWASPADFVVTQDAQGNPVTPYISPHIDEVFSQLSQTIGWEQGIVNDLGGALKLTQAVTPMIQVAIKRREDEQVQIKARVAANNKKIKEAQDNMKKVVDLQKKVQTERKKSKPNRGSISSWTKQIATLRLKTNQLFGIKTTHNDPSSYDNNDANSPELRADWNSWNKDTKKLQNENWAMIGDFTNIPDPPGGEYGIIAGELGTAPSTDALLQVEGSATSASGLYEALTTVQGWQNAIGGPTGDLAAQTAQLQEYQQGLAQLRPGASAQLAGTAGQATQQQEQTLLSIAQQQLTIAGQALAVSEAQTAVLSDLASGVAPIPGLERGGLFDPLNMPPFGGMFAEGGIVPGPLGEPRTVIAHGGEEINKPASPRVRIKVEDHRTRVWVDDVEQIVEAKTRQIARPAVHPVPSRGGGWRGPIR